MLQDLRYGLRLLAKSPAFTILIGVGLALGFVAALALTAIIPPDLLPRVSVRDPLTFAATSALLGAVALVASSIPAWRATRIDPLIALRTD
jgi:putative ABC transport system permease protein